jgi:hypothetical protein
MRRKLTEPPASTYSSNTAVHVTTGPSASAE